MPYPEGDKITCRECGAEMLISNSAKEEKYVCQECNAIILVFIRSEGEQIDPRYTC